MNGASKRVLRLLFKADFQFMGKSGATLLGLSFAAVVFGYSGFYNPSMPPLLRERMFWFLASTIVCTFLFVVSSLLSFVAIAFAGLEQNRAQTGGGAKKQNGKVTFLAVACSVCYVAGLICFIGALYFITGVQVQVPFAPPPQPTG